MICPNCGHNHNASGKAQKQADNLDIARWESTALKRDDLAFFETTGARFLPSPAEAIQAAIIGGAVGAAVFTAIYSGFTSYWLVADKPADSQLATQVALTIASLFFAAGVLYQQITINNQREGYRRVETQESPHSKPETAAIIWQREGANNKRGIVMTVSTNKLKEFARLLEGKDYDLTYRTWVPGFFTRSQFESVLVAIRKLGIGSKNNTGTVIIYESKKIVLQRWASGNFEDSERRAFYKD